MRALLFPGDRRVEVAELPDPSPGPGEAVVRVHASGICGTDLHKYREPAGTRRPFAAMVGGHEAVGEVAEVGAGVDPAIVGLRVVAWHIWGCLDAGGPCAAAVASEGMFCAHAAVHGRNVHGTNAEYHVVPADRLLELPPDVSDEIGVLLACNAGTAFRAVGKLGPLEGAPVVVWGLGPVGLSCAVAVAAAGAVVTGVDVAPDRLAFARAIGVAAQDHHIGLADVAVETTGLRAVQSRLPESVRHGGQILLVGLGPGTGLERTNLITLKELVVRGSLVFSRHDWPGLLAFARAAGASLARIVSHRCTWRDAPEAFALADASRTGKVVFDWS